MTVSGAVTGADADLRHPERGAPLQDINHAFLQFLVELARSNAGQENGFVVALSRQLRALRSTPLARVARTPFLLLDMEFRNDIWWKALSKDALRAPTAPKTWLSQFPRTPSIKLARSALMLAWHLARTERESCPVLLGMSPSVTEAMAGMQPPQIDKIAEHHYAHLRPRWEDRPDVWRELLSTGEGDVAIARAFALYAMQLTWGSLHRSP